jgi:NitT/TauT family transport system permease protein
MTASSGVSAVVVLVSFIALWQLAVLVFDPPAFIIPSPWAILQEIAAQPGWYLSHTLYTLWACLLGFALALVIGVLAAVGIVYSRILEHTLYALLVSLNSIPKIALAPLFIIWMGTGLSSKVAISMLIALFSIVIDTVLGLRSADPDAIDLSRSLRASPMQILFTIRFPNALPALFAGMKVAISLALVGAIAGEFVASQVGLGYVILVAQGMFLTTRVFAAILLLGVLGTVLFYLVDMVERILIPWHVSHRAAQAAPLQA